jgi:hypothetical protein
MVPWSVRYFSHPCWHIYSDLIFLNKLVSNNPSSGLHFDIPRVRTVTFQASFSHQNRIKIKNMHHILYLLRKALFIKSNHNSSAQAKIML